MQSEIDACIALATVSLKPIFVIRQLVTPRSTGAAHHSDMDGFRSVDDF